MTQQISNPLSKPIALLLIAAIWFIAMSGAATALFAAYIGRADFGDGGASQMTGLAAVALVVLAASAPVVAWLVTRLLLRRL